MGHYAGVLESQTYCCYLLPSDSACHYQPAFWGHPTLVSKEALFPGEVVIKPSVLVSGTIAILINL